MTGRSAVAIRMVRFTSPLPADLPALPDQLRDRAGYFTGVGGRHYHLDGPSATGRPRGAPKLARRSRSTACGHSPTALTTSKNAGHEGLRGKSWPPFSTPCPKASHGSSGFGFSDPHHVWDKTGSRGVPDPASLTLPPCLPDLPGVRSDLARYLGEIEHLDGDIQDVLDVLESRGLGGNTLVVFMGDNGLALPHGKGSLYDPGIAVPTGGPLARGREAGRRHERVDLWRGFRSHHAGSRRCCTAQRDERRELPQTAQRRAFRRSEIHLRRAWTAWRRRGHEAQHPGVDV